jgi:hypothetical protein
MNRFVALLVFVFAVALLEGCATTPTFTRVTAAPGARIGVVDLLSAPGLRNVHVGYTVFGNYDNDLGSDWQLDQRARDDVRTLLQGAGYEIVDVAVQPAQAEAIRKGEDQTNYNYNGLTDTWKQAYQELLDQNNLAALVVLRDEVRYFGEHGPVLTGYGVMSVLGRTPSAGYLYVTATADVIGDRPPHRSIGACYGSEHLDASLVQIDNFADAKLSDLAPLRPHFEALVDHRIGFELATAGLVAGSVECPPMFPVHHPPSRKLQ